MVLSKLIEIYGELAFLTLKSMLVRWSKIEENIYLIGRMQLGNLTDMSSIVICFLSPILDWHRLCKHVSSIIYYFSTDDRHVDGYVDNGLRWHREEVFP